VLLVVWALSGFYIVDERERALVLRFGRYVYTTGPGPHWHIPYPIESVETISLVVRDAQHQATMLTQDENIVAIDIAAQYRVKDAANYAFQVRVPDATLSQVMESAVREVVGKSTMDFVLAAGRDKVSADTRALMQRTLNQYHTGLQVLTVNLLQTQPPEPVQPAFEDVVMAREDRIRFINEAQSYANGIIPQARGEAARVRQEAVAYREETIAAAQGDTSRFRQLLTEYSQAPRVTRDRLYLDTMEAVLSNSSKILMDIQGGNNLLYLPLDKLMRQGAGAGTGNMPAPPVSSLGSRAETQGDLREPRSLDGREVR
jgi:membrane protease subunit HflK